ncbi:MAG TPA: LLM class flavin-dependent oxidoreductase [Natronosporangium sp.]|nr:LLM class flavin-dependent oxidoreductase [Natronosporangium sp.]
MKIGIGLPNTVPGTPGDRLLEWARRAEEAGFAGLATIDRLVYPSYDTLATLAAAAGATSRIELVSNILLAPLHSPLMLAKSAASIDQLSGGRLTLGVAVGGRADDYAAAGRDFSRRGRDLDAALELMHQAWRGEAFAYGAAVTPPPVRGDRVPLLIGGTGEAALRRTVTWGVGWTAGGGTPEMAAPVMARIRDMWREAGREGEPRFAALAYYALGDDAADRSRANLRDYYAFLGPYADRVADSALRTPQAVRDAVSAFADIGCTELYLDPTVASLDQIDRLADLVL